MSFLSKPRFWITVCLISTVAIHSVFLIAEMFLSQTDLVQETLLGDFTIEQKAEILAHNVGLYNGFLSAGALWGLLSLNPQLPKIKPAVFILVCAAIAGIYGSLSLSSPIAFLLQSLPSMIALLLMRVEHANEHEATQQDQPA